MSQEKPLPSLWWLRIGVALAVALPLALLAVGSWMAQRDAERIAATRLDDLTRVMEEHAERALERNAMVFRELQRVLGEDSDARLRARERALHELLAAICDRLPHIRAIALRGADGRTLVSSHLYPVPRSTLPVEWQDHRGVSQPRTRRGFIEIELQPSHFVDFYSRLTKPEDQVAFRLVTGDGRVLARWPAAPQAGLRVVDETYSASRAVGQHAVFVSASQPPKVVLAPWRHQTQVLAAIALPSAAALLYASLLALRRTRRLQEEARERARAEERLRHSQKMDALGELTGGVAHDFGNLLAVVNNAAHVLSESQAKDHPAVAAILRAVESGSRLTRQLLSFARRQPLNPERIELERALPGFADLLKSSIGSGVTLGIHVAPDTPAVCVDRGELEMALLNLAANARDAMNRSGELEILARAAEPGEGPQPGRRYAIVSVSDSGQGIPAEILPRVFDPFFTTKPAGSGTGLGLSQVYGFCQQAGGGVQLESDVGIGTTVSLFLPAAAGVSAVVARERRREFIEAA
jgi:two-component system NtrC family sensor kinase